jgi:RimJ/RimL family protein N-acetyltransferase
VVVHLDKTPGPHDVNSLSFPSALPLHGLRLDLEPLTVAHAAEMAPLLDDVDLHTFTGGVPLRLEELTERYRRQVLGRSADGSEAWLNWVVRRRDTGRAAGYLQVTVTREQDLQVAELAWVISPVHQHQGFATEAATAVADWLRSSGITTLVAHIHPDNLASATIAQRIGLHPTADEQDGEIRWTTGARESSFS